MREITFDIPGTPSLTIHAQELDDGTLLLDLAVTGDELADLRGMYFDIADQAMLDNLVITGPDVTDQDYGKVSNFKNGNNIKGEGRGPYDVGVDLGTPGMSKDDLGETSFVLSSLDGSDLTLDLIANTEFAARMTSVGLPDSARDDSQKTSVIAPAAPDAIDDQAGTLEDVPVTVDVVSNDTDADGDMLTVVEVGQPSNGSVEIVDNEILYTSDEHWSGTDSFMYRIFDGDGGYDWATATIEVEAVADAPNLSLALSPGENVNEVVVNITSSLVDTDGSESYILSFSDLPEGVVLQGATDGQITMPSGDDSVTLQLADDSDFDFDFTVSATSTEASNGDMATSMETVEIVYDYNEISEQVVFEAENQSIWTTGDEFVFNDSRFLGIDIDDSGNTDLGIIETGWSYDIKAGFQSDLTFEGGDIDADIPWQLDFATSYNRSTDVLTLATSAMLIDGGGFSTDGPSLEYMLDFVFNYAFTADVDLTLAGVIDEDLFTLNLGPSNNSVELVDYDSDTSGGLSYEFPYGITATLEWPNLEVEGSQDSLGTYSGNGASNNALDINLDIDTALADIFLGGVNPFDLTVDIGIAGATLELVDLDVNAGLNFLQSFELMAGELDATLIFEDGSEQDFTFGDELIFNAASVLDEDGDGDVEFEVELALLESTLNNDTDLGFNVGYNFDLLKGSWYYDVLLASDSGTFGPAVDLGDTLPVASIDVFEDTVGVAFQDESLDIFA